MDGVDGKRTSKERLGKPCYLIFLIGEVLNAV
jgi:hypothetical protein